MNKQSIIWDNEGWATSDGWVSAYCTDTATGEYIGPYDVWVSIGTGLPAGAYLDSPPAKEPGKAIVRIGPDWALMADHRGQVAYNKMTRSASLIANVGELSAELTLLEPQSSFDVWDEVTNAWLKDDDAEQQSLTNQQGQQKNALLAEAAAMIATLQDAVDIGIATPEEDAARLDWKRYRVMLTRVDVTLHPVIWPPKPAASI